MFKATGCGNDITTQHPFSEFCQYWNVLYKQDSTSLLPHNAYWINFFVVYRDWKTFLEIRLGNVTADLNMYQKWLVTFGLPWLWSVEIQVTYFFVFLTSSGCTDICVSTRKCAPHTHKITFSTYFNSHKTDWLMDRILDNNSYSNICSLSKVVQSTTHGSIQTINTTYFKHTKAGFRLLTGVISTAHAWSVQRMRGVFSACVLSIIFGITLVHIRRYFFRSSF